MKIQHLCINLANGGQDYPPVDDNKDYLSIHEAAVACRRAMSSRAVGVPSGFVTGASFIIEDPVKGSSRYVHVSDNSYCVTFIRDFTRDEKYLQQYVKK